MVKKERAEESGKTRKPYEHQTDFITLNFTKHYSGHGKEPLLKFIMESGLMNLQPLIFMAMINRLPIKF